MENKMYKIDLDSLMKKIPQFHKYLLNNIETNLNSGNLEETYNSLEDYKSFREIMKNNGIYFKKFDKQFEKLESRILEGPELEKTWKGRIVDNYLNSSNKN